MFNSDDFIGESYIAQGAFGQVYKTFSISKGYNVAIKKIRDEDRFRKAVIKRNRNFKPYKYTSKGKLRNTNS